MRQMEQWRCKHGHILGFVRWNHKGESQLRLLRMALDMKSANPEEVDFLGPLVGTIEVRCSICGVTRVWAATDNDLIILFNALDDKDAFDFWVKLLEKAKAPMSAKEISSPNEILRSAQDDTKEE